MKRLFALLIAAAMLIALAGCGLATARGEVVDVHYFEGDLSSVLIQEIVAEGKTAELYSVGRELPSDIALGDVVEVLYRGGVQETFPAGFDEVWSVKIVEKFDASAPEIGIVSGESAIEPCSELRWAKSWSGGGWVSASYDAPTLEELIEGGQLMSIVYSDDLAIDLRSDVSITSFAVRDEALELVEGIDSVEALASLAPGRYFVRLGYEKRGAYVDEAFDFCTSGGARTLSWSWGRSERAARRAGRRRAKAARTLGRGNKRSRLP